MLHGRVLTLKKNTSHSKTDMKSSQETKTWVKTSLNTSQRGILLPEQSGMPAPA